MFEIMLYIEITKWITSKNIFMAFSGKYLSAEGELHDIL
jgi:hypothetical protein